MFILGILTCFLLSCKHIYSCDLPIVLMLTVSISEFYVSSCIYAVLVADPCTKLAYILLLDSLTTDFVCSPGLDWGLIESAKKCLKPVWGNTCKTGYLKSIFSRLCTLGACLLSLRYIIKTLLILYIY